ncbi:MAG: hypothetical protein AUI15_30740 [Actinobacteria bacterium 13_2_20CM_2_66_6]|nr:MAG: hypothetical protein AUI15_30740 [Actinobacteria bacterium 13_2_20CM_2_66_6]
MLQVVAPGPDLGEQLILLQRQVDLLLLEHSRVAAEFARTTQWADEGSNSAIDWIRFNCNLTEKAAGDRIAVGSKLTDLAESSQAMQSGEIGFAHLTVIARTAVALGKRFDESVLLGLARKMSPGKLYYKSMRYRHSMDAKGYALEQADAVENRHLRLTTGEDGCLLINGVLDPVGGAVVRTALEPLARRTAWDDGRDQDKRNADALVELAHGGKPANLQITASVETVKGLVGATGGEMEFSLPLSSTSVQRMACDCSVMRVLLDQESVVVDVGRSKRVISGPARRALKARDGHCQWAGCERPASRCDGHHLVHWINGGNTELSNLILLCHRHHWLVHEGGWQLIKTDDRGLLPIAPTVTFGLPPPDS